jgi:hypothetical protein
MLNSQGGHTHVDVMITSTTINKVHYRSMKNVYIERNDHGHEMDTQWIHVSESVKYILMKEIDN